MPARLIGRRVRVQLGASQLLVFDGRVEVARHERCTTKGGQVLVLDNYLEVLLRKRGALPGASALAQARARGVFTATHDAFWAAARKALGDTAGTRALIEVLLLHRRLARHLVVAGIAAALSVGSVSPDVVAVEARKRSPDGVTPAEVPRGRGRVVSLPERRLADLPRDERPLPTVDAYDQLLTGTSEVTR